MTFSEWSEKYYLLPPGSSTPGLVNMDLTPLNREILNELSPHSPTQEIIYVKGTQIAGTTISDQATQAIVDLYPAAYLMLFGTQEMARTHVITRVERAIEKNVRLKGKIKSAFDKKSGTNRFLKMFPGGYGRYAGGMAGTAYRHDSYQYVFLDDADSFTRDVGGTKTQLGEGSPVELARSRMDAQQGKGKFYISGTPTDKETSIVWNEFIKTDQRKPFAPCPECGFEQVIEWAQIKYNRNDKYELISEPYFECIKCGAKIPESKKQWMVHRAKWRPTEKTINKLKRGYWQSSLYSLLGITWSKIVQEWLDAVSASRRGDQTKMVRFFNHRLALPYENKNVMQIDAKLLNDYREDYSTIPEQAAIITAGIDVQLDRFEITFVAYDENDHRYFIEHKKIYGDPWVKYGQPGSVFEDLESEILRTFENDYGKQQPIMQIAMDAGYCTKNVSQFINAMQEKSVPIVAVFGGTGRVKTKDFIGSPSVNEHGTEIIELYVSIGKEITYNQLKKPGGVQMIHFLNHKSFNSDFFTQLTVERPMYKTVNGKRSLVWDKKSGARNEATDTTNYSLAAFNIWHSGLEIKWESYKQWNAGGCVSSSHTYKQPELSSGVAV